MLLLALVGPAIAGEHRYAIGGQIEEVSHGIVDLGWRNEHWSVQLLTDTVDVRWRTERERGRHELGLRVATIAAGMWINPWSEGAPQPDEQRFASYAGIDGAWQRWGPHGLYWGVQGFVRPFVVWKQPSGTGSPEVDLWGQALWVGGLHTEQVHARISLGADVTSTSVHPHVELWAETDGPWQVSPVTGVWLGGVGDTGEITAIRLGGLTPYHVPFAGAAWAEFWVEQFAVGRLGGRVTFGPVRLRALVDAGTWREARLPYRAVTAVGLALDAQWRSEGGWFAQLTVAHSPTLPRGEGVWPVPVWFAIGRDWAPIRRGAR